MSHYGMMPVITVSSLTSQKRMSFRLLSSPVCVVTVYTGKMVVHLYLQGNVLTVATFSVRMMTTSVSRKSTTTRLKSTWSFTASMMLLYLVYKTLCTNL